ncbi:MAG: UbiA family prenyltransferase, partial [Bacteroidota bacterium]
MFSRSTWQHLRIPFSIFLMPVFLFALAFDPQVVWWEAVLIFIILHLLVYPASNGFNSYFDKDEDSIGGVEKPLPVSRQLYWAALLFDALGLLLSLIISIEFALMVLLYGLISKAYSHPSVRLKKYPVAGWLIVGLFQGYFTWCMVWIGLHGWTAFLAEPAVHLPAALSTLLLWGSYPMTQVYQHEEDARRGDQTLSLMLGVRGTFRFVMVVFGLANFSLLFLFYSQFSLTLAVLFQLALTPVLIFFLRWYLAVLKDVRAADFKRTMQLNLLSSC